MIHFFHNFFWCISACIQHIPHPFQRPARQAALRLQRRLGGDLHRGRRALRAPSHAWLRGTKGYLPQSGGRNIAVKLMAKRMGKGCQKRQIHTKSVAILIWPVWSDVVYIFGIALSRYLLVFLFVPVCRTGLFLLCHHVTTRCPVNEMSWSWVWKAIFRFFEPSTGTGQCRIIGCKLRGWTLIDSKHLEDPLGVEEIPLPCHWFVTAGKSKDNVDITLGMNLRHHESAHYSETANSGMQQV